MGVDRYRWENKYFYGLDIISCYFVFLPSLSRSLSIHKNIWLRRKYLTHYQLYVIPRENENK